MAYGLSYMPDFSRAYSGITDAGKAIGKGLEQRGENKKKSNKLGGTLEAYAPTDEEQVELYGETVDNMGFSQREAAMAKYVAMREQQGRKLFEDFEAAGKAQAQLFSDDAAMGAATQPTSFDSSITDAKMGIKQSDLKLDQAMKERDDARKKVSLWETEKGHISRHKEGAEKGYAGGRKHEIVPGKVSEPITRKLLPLDSGKVDERTKALQGSIGNLQAKIGKLDLDINKEVARGNSLNLDLSKATESQALERDKNMNAARDAASAAPLDIQGALRTAIQANPQAGTNEITGLLKYAQTGMEMEVQGRTKEARIGAAQAGASQAVSNAKTAAVVAGGAQLKENQEAVKREIEIKKALQTAGVSPDLATKIDSGNASAVDLAGLNPTQFKAAGQMVTFRVNQQNANTQQALMEMKKDAEATKSGLNSSDLSFLRASKAEHHKSYTDLDRRLMTYEIMEDSSPGMLAKMGINLADLKFEREQAKESYDHYSKMSADIIKNFEEQLEVGGASKKFTPPAAGMVKVKDPSGKAGSIPKSQLPAALKSGYTQVK